MKKKHWMLLILIVFSTWFMDSITKQWALHSFTNLKTWGPFAFLLHYNSGAILGSFSNLPPLLRVVTLSTCGVFVIFIYAALQYLLPHKNFMLRIGMSLLLGGILGNVSDRTQTGAVIDFIFLRFGEWNSPVFNIADMIQWIGYILISYPLLFDSESIWPRKNERKNIWVLPGFQMKYVMILFSIGGIFSLVSGVFAFTYLKMTISNLARSQAYFLEDRFLQPFVLTYLAICASFLVILFIIGRIMSHRVAGPVYALENYIDSLIKGEDRHFKLRQGDELRHLEELGQRLRSAFMSESNTGPSKRELNIESREKELNKKTEEPPLTKTDSSGKSSDV